MPFRDAFNAKLHNAPAPGKTVPAADGGGRTAVFLTPQALTSFPIASAAVMLIWRVAQHVLPSAKAPWVGLVISLLVAALVALISLTDKRVSLSTREKAIAVGVFIINWLYLYAAVVGINDVLPGGGTGNPPTINAGTHT